MVGSIWRRGFAVVAVALVAACSGEPSVPTAEVRRGRIRESFVEPAKTRLEVRHVVSMPVSARVGRIALKEGDPVSKGQALLDVDRLPLEKAAAEARARVREMEAAIALKRDNRVEDRTLESSKAQALAMQEQLHSAESAAAAEKARLNRNVKELARLEELMKANAIPATRLDDQRLATETSTLDVARAESTRAEVKAMLASSNLQPAIIADQIARKDLEIAVMEQQLAQSRERAARAEHDLALSQIVSPVDGVILERYELGGGPLMEGTRVFLVGSLDTLEVEGEILTQDAVKLVPGAAVEYAISSGAAPLHGKVLRTFPAAFTKLSSLGVEQQRVIVVSSIEGRPAALGYGFRLQARYFKGEADGALIVPRSAVLQGADDSYFVFKADGSKARKTPVKLGLKSDFEVQIVEGLAEGDRIVATPDATMKDGGEL